MTLSVRPVQRSRGQTRDDGSRVHVVIAVQNCSVPRDRRVWREATALVDAGYDVTVIAPCEPGEPRKELLDGVRLYRYPRPRNARALAGYMWETVHSLWWTALHFVRVRVRHPVAVFQACNPPDTYFLLALPAKLLGVRFVFDHHDLAPELYAAKFDRPRKPLRILMLVLERLTFATADFVFTTNESMRHVAITRGRVPEESISVVRNGPDAAGMRRGREVAELRRGRPNLGCYIGFLARQDGVDGLLRAIRIYVQELEHTDCTFAIVGDGEAFGDLRQQVRNYGLESYVDMPGWLDDAKLHAYLSTAAFGLCPEPNTELNRQSSMIKTSEYMAYGLPVIAFDLHETRVTAGEAALYVEPGDERAFAVAMAKLLADPMRRSQMGMIGRERVDRALAWEHQKKAYLDAYARITAS